MSTSIASGHPHPSLSGVVLRYEGYRAHTAHPVTFRELPCTFAPVIIDLDTGWLVTHGGGADAAPTRLGSFVAGLTDGPVLVRHNGSAHCLQIDLTPLGARRLLGVPMSELANRSVPIGDVLAGVFGRRAHRLVQRVGETPDWSARFALVDRAIRARLAETPPVEREVAWSLAQLMDSGGAVAIGGLAGELGWSHRRLIARFRDAVGLPPKLVGRIVRFEHLTATVATNPAVDWADAATMCGYFDQAHLAREVRDLAGITPTELRSAGVNSVQDDTAVPALALPS